MNGDGKQPQVQVQVPPFGEMLMIGTTQLPLPNGQLVVLLNLSGPGRTFSCLLAGEDAENWGKQLQHAGTMSKAGLYIQAPPAP